MVNSLIKFKFYFIFGLGGIVDFVVVEVIKNYIFKYFYYVSGGGWGGKYINEVILKRVKKMFSKEDLILFESMRVDVLDIENEIEMKKKDLKKGDELFFSLLLIFLS